MVPRQAVTHSIQKATRHPIIEALNSTQSEIKDTEFINNDFLFFDFPRSLDPRMRYHVLVHDLGPIQSPELYDPFHQKNLMGLLRTPSLSS